MFLASDKAKTLPRASQLRITRAPLWCFPPKICSCLPPRLRPSITNPPKVKLPLSIQWTPAAQCCLSGGISSLLAPSPPPCYSLGLRCLLQYVLATICPVVGISHHSPPSSQIQRTKQTLPPTLETQMMTAQLTMMQRSSDADNDADVNADNNNATQMTNDDTDNRG